MGKSILAGVLSMIITFIVPLCVGYAFTDGNIPIAWLVGFGIILGGFVLVVLVLGLFQILKQNML